VKFLSSTRNLTVGPDERLFDCNGVRHFRKMRLKSGVVRQKSEKLPSGCVDLKTSNRRLCL
jgi:hypothetical protein